MLKHCFANNDFAFVTVFAKKALGQSGQSRTRARDTVTDRLRKPIDQRALFLRNALVLRQSPHGFESRFVFPCSVIDSTGESDHLEILSLRPFVKWMIMALSTFQSSTEENPHGVGHIVLRHIAVAQIISNGSVARF